MAFIVFISISLLLAHIITPLGTLFIDLINLQNPNMLASNASFSSYITQLISLHIPAIFCTFILWFKYQLNDKLPSSTPLIIRSLIAGIGIYFLIMIGRFDNDSLGAFLNTHTAMGLLLARILLLVGCTVVVINMQTSGKGNNSDNGSSQGGGDEEQALAALMGMMGGGGMGGAPKGSAGSPKGGGFKPMK
ncbi:MAG: hypothetical protein V4525_01850 [Pseudomonadota bacterium]